MNGKPYTIPERHFVVAELTVNITGGVLEGRIDDWPAYVQDAIYTALGRLSGRARKTYKIIHSLSDELDGQPFIHVVAVAEIKLQ